MTMELRHLRCFLAIAEEGTPHHLGLTAAGHSCTEPLMMGPRPLAGAADLTVSLAWTHPPTHPAIAKLVTLAREVVAYRPPGAA
jgi:hypothetical protein